MGYEPLKAPRPRPLVSVDAAIAAQQVYVELQPVVELATGQVHGYEALARCRRASLASPRQLLDAAEDQGVLVQLGRELRRLAVAAVDGARLFFSVHPAVLDDDGILRDDDPLAQHPGELVLEVPEATPRHDHRFVLATLRARGVRIALDDFGAGNANFSYIAQLAPELVKFDRELIADATLHSRQFRLLASLNALCTAQGARVIAEGVETAAELAAVIAAGIPYAQGFYLGRPSATGAPAWTPS
jgi:EAL domain-containing protein (putative c-di-GMP-specific phosphodiesterase class I)